MTKLKPCPWCNGEVRMKSNANTLTAQVICDRCGVIMKKNYKGSTKINTFVKELITEAWNKREPEE